MDGAKLPALIRQAEERLLRLDDLDELEALLAPELEEVGPDGRVTGRAAVLAWLRNKDPRQRWVFEEFQVQALAADLALARYRARSVREDGLSAGSRRVSLWRRREGPGWQLLYHQATPCRTDSRDS